MVPQTTFDLIGRIIDPSPPRPTRRPVAEPRPEPESLEVLIGRILSPGPGVPML
jgi:hypothetical protein